MLSVYTRHSHECDHRDDINWRRCRCPKWIQGVIADDRAPVRVTAKTRSWEQAEARAREMESAADPAKPQIKPAVTIVEAVSGETSCLPGLELHRATIPSAFAICAF
jgi:hypothetical protein